MPDDKKQGSIHSSSEGGTAGIYPAPDPSEFLVAPSTSTESNNINLNLFLTAYMCISDIRFKFDSSFVLPAVQAEMQAFSSLRKQNPQVMGSPISIFGHADPSFQGNFEVGSQYAKSGDDYNKTLSGRRAVAIYALLIRDPSFWNTLYAHHLGGDVWGEDSIRIMLDALGQGGSSGSGGSSQNSSDSAKNSRVHDIANDSGQRQQLFLQYMSFLCGDLKLDKSADFLARNAGPDQKGDVQGCSRFNPLLLFSSEDEARFKQAFADNDETTLRGERDPRNAVNRRVMILIFKKGSQVLPAKWPCPSYKDGTAGCIKRFWSDGDTRRSTHNSGAERKFELSADTLACRFYQRISGDKSPCNSTSPPPPPPQPCPKQVEFKEDTSQVYGFDDKTANGPYKSVEKGQTDTAKAQITLNGGVLDGLSFVSSVTSKVTLSPTKASSADQTLNFTGVDKGESEVKALCGGKTLGKMQVKTYLRKTRTVAVRVVNGKGWPAKSTDVSDAAIQDALKKVYMQAVVEFTVKHLPALEVDFDINKDGKIDVNSWMSDEMKAVRDACKDDSYDFNIFLVDNPSDGSTGFMDYNQRYGFIHAGNSPNAAQTIAHELGHGQGLAHENADAVNVMHPTAEAAPGDFTKWRLRKPQWDKVNP
jgi:hypothetical protein